MMGSMGNALAIGIGVAMYVPNRVFVINGDGSALMGLGSMVIAESLNLRNLHHLILDNRCHESTGGQKTSSYYYQFSRTHRRTIAYECEIGAPIPPRIPMQPYEITRRFKDVIKAFSYK